MKSKNLSWWLTKASILFYLLLPSPTAAQIVPDRTLPMNSQITKQGNVTVIEGGTRAGTNLFHSLEKLSVPSEGIVQFDNALDIQNIITRVTGRSKSDIDGLIKANGTANLFLINPNGIIFGPNASLEIGGSFLASTASSLKFADGFEFSAVAPDSTPLLTISIPIGLGFADDPGRIQVQDSSALIGLKFQPPDNPLRSPITIGIKTSGLSVQPGKTLALVGGDLSLDGATLTAENGQIELGSVSDGSFVNLIPINKGWTLSYENAHLKDINLSQASLVDASGVTGGSIQVQGANVKLTDGSVILIQNIGTQENESLKVYASESLELSGSTPDGGIISNLRTSTMSPRFQNFANKPAEVDPTGIGKGSADLVISTKRLILREGDTIGTVTNNAAKGGNVIINASESMQIIGTSPFTRFQESSIFAVTTINLGGKAGNITISTGDLTVADGAFVGASTTGSGAGGDLRIDATNSIELIGAPSFIGTRALSSGNAGVVTINTPKLVATDGGRVDTSTLASGSAGSIIINADFVDLYGTGKSLGTLIHSSVSSSADIPSVTTQKFFGIPAIPEGKSGDVTINAEKLKLTNGGRVSVKNDGSNSAGILKINSDSIHLNNSSITATANSGQGGNIDLQSGDLQLRQGSTITATAGNRGDGGNIIINAETLAALENSSITANAFEGKGGNIRINTTGLFLSPDSTITASSERGINGTIEINTPNPNLTKAAVVVEGAVNIPKVGAICSGNPNNATTGEFVNIGKGGLPSNPLDDPLDISTGWHDSTTASASTKPIQNESTQEHIEAQGWAPNPDGTVRLTTEPTSETAYSSQAIPPCNQVGQEEQKEQNQ